MRNSSEGWISSEAVNSQLLVFSLPGASVIRVKAPVIVTGIATNDREHCGLTPGTIIRMSGIELQFGVQSELPRGFLIRQR